MSSFFMLHTVRHIFLYFFLIMAICASQVGIIAINVIGDELFPKSGEVRTSVSTSFNLCVIRI
jgi:hypothetical protein